MRTGRHFVLVRWTRPFPRTGGALRALDKVAAALPDGKSARRRRRQPDGQAERPADPAPARTHLAGRIAPASSGGPIGYSRCRAVPDLPRKPPFAVGLSLPQLHVVAMI